MSASAQARVIGAQSIRVRRPRREQPPFASRLCEPTPRSVPRAVAVRLRRPESRDRRRSPRLPRPGCGHSRRPDRAGSAASRRSTTARCRPSPVTSRSGDGRQRRAERADRDRHQPEQPHAACSTGTARSRPPTISPNAQPGIEGSSATAPFAEEDGMREPQQAVDRSAAQPPQRPAPADDVEQQRARLERHDDEGRQRDGDDVGADAVKPRAMEMEQRHRRSARPRPTSPVAMIPKQARARSARRSLPRAAGAGAAPSSSNGGRRSR